MSTGKRCPHQTPPPGLAWFEWKCIDCGEGLRMRALSLHSPYPHLILQLPKQHWKNVENRQRAVMSTLGPLLIHTSARATHDRHAAALTVARKAGVPEELLPAWDSQPLGGIVGCVLVSQVLPKSSLLDHSYRWKFPEHVGYVLSKRVALPLREVSGGQGVFHVDLTSEEEALVRRAGIL